MNDIDKYDYAPGGKSRWCRCMQDKGVVTSRKSICNDRKVSFDDEFKMIDTNVYDGQGWWDHIEREFVLSDAEYFKRKLAGK